MIPILLSFNIEAFEDPDLVRRNLANTNQVTNVTTEILNETSFMIVGSTQLKYALYTLFRDPHDYSDFYLLKNLSEIEKILENFEDSGFVQGTHNIFGFETPIGCAYQDVFFGIPYRAGYQKRIFYKAVKRNESIYFSGAIIQTTFNIENPLCECYRYVDMGMTKGPWWAPLDAEEISNLQSLINKNAYDITLDAKNRLQNRYQNFSQAGWKNKKFDTMVIKQSPEEFYGIPSVRPPSLPNAPSPKIIVNPHSYKEVHPIDKKICQFLYNPPSHLKV